MPLPFILSYGFVGYGKMRFMGERLGTGRGSVA